MTDTRIGKPGKSGAARAIRAILALQIGIAGLLFAGDIASVLPQLGFSPKAPQLDGPVSPGNQTRRYDPARLPAAPPSTRPGTDAPPAADLPSRLHFTPAPADPGRLRMTGTIAPGDAGRFADWLETSAYQLETVELDSPGGSVTDALEIGRLLRAAGADTAVAAGDICLSACPYILAAGLRRSAGDPAYIGVHQHYFDENTVLPAFLAVKDIQRGQGLVLEYLLEMGIDPGLMTHALSTPPEEIYILLRRELEDYALVTPRDAPPG